MEIFGNDLGIRGCFVVFPTNSSASRGAVLHLPMGGQRPTSHYSDPLLVVGFSVAQRESVAFLKAFSGKVYTYAFGHDPNASVATVNFLGFMVEGQEYSPSGGGGGPMVQSKITDTMLSDYKSNRVSASLKYAYLGLGNSKPVKGFIVGLHSETIDAEHSIQQFVMHLALPEVQ